MKNITIYILEDDRFYAEFIKAHLALDEIDSIIFTKESDCISAIKTRKPDVLILDHKLEHTTGLEIMEAIGKHINDIAVIYLSAQDHYHVTLKALRNGAVDYIEKGTKAAYQLKNVLKKIQKHSLDFSLPVNLREYRLDTNFKAEY